MTRRWYDFRAQAKGAEIVIYDEIGAFGIPAKAFLDELKALGPVAELTVRINSPGGSVFDGVAIYNALKRHDAAITVWIDGIAASIASMIAMAGDEVVMPENAMLMLHDPSGLVMGTASDMRAMAEALDRMKAGMVAAYRDKSGRDDAEIEALMHAETWLSAAGGGRARPGRPGRGSRSGWPRTSISPASATRRRSSRRSSPRPLRRRTTCLIPRRPARASLSRTKPRPWRHGAETSADDTRRARRASQPTPTEPAPGGRERSQATPTARGSPPQPTAQVIDLDAVRADERRATLAYVAEVHELCALAGRGDLAAGLHRQGHARRPDPPRPARGPRRRGRGHRHPQPGAAGHGRAGAACDRHRGDLRRPQPALPIGGIHARAQEGRYAGEFVVSEGNGKISRETITVLSGQTLEAGAVLGKVTASGKYKALDPAAVDGSEAAAGILYDAVDASAADAEGVAIVRLAEVNAAELVWPAGITAPQQTTALGQLAALTIIAR